MCFHYLFVCEECLAYFLSMLAHICMLSIHCIYSIWHFDRGSKSLYLFMFDTHPCLLIGGAFALLIILSPFWCCQRGEILWVYISLFICMCIILYMFISFMHIFLFVNCLSSSKRGRLLAFLFWWWLTNNLLLMLFV